MIEVTADLEPTRAQRHVARVLGELHGTCNIAKIDPDDLVAEMHAGGVTVFVSPEGERLAAVAP